MGSKEETTHLAGERREVQSSHELPPIPARSSLFSNSDIYNDSSTSKFQSYKGHGQLNSEVNKRKYSAGEKGGASYGNTFYLPTRRSARSKSYSDNLCEASNFEGAKQRQRLYRQLDEELNKVFIGAGEGVQESQRAAKDTKKLPKTINSSSGATVQHRLLRRSLSDNDVIAQARRYSETRQRYAARTAVRPDRRPPLTPNTSPKPAGEDRVFPSTEAFPTSRTRNYVNEHIVGKLKERVRSASKIHNTEQVPKTCSQWRLKEGPWDTGEVTEEALDKEKAVLEERNERDSNKTRILAWLENCERARQEEDSRVVTTVISIVSDD